jgi:hypothetical protein
MLASFNAGWIAILADLPRTIGRISIFKFQSDAGRNSFQPIDNASIAGSYNT